MLQCSSDVFFEQARALDRKGFTIDDTTFQYCPLKIPELWPNSQAPAMSVRVFQAWNKGWSRDQRPHAWNSFQKVVELNAMKVLMATPITCNATDDEVSWRWTKKLLEKLGPENVMGFAVGNELELLFSQKPQQCVLDLWDGGRLWRTFQQRVAEIDKMGFGNVPVTSVFTGGVVYQGFPFTNIPGQALVGDFLKNATEKYGKRFAFTFNIYPYFDHNLQMDPENNATCFGAIKRATCWEGEECLAVEAMMRIRRRMQALTNRPDDTFWVGEIGWSAPVTVNLDSAMRGCDDFSSLATLSAFYGGFLRWDLTLPNGVRSPDHVFYFTLRDALNFGLQEHFGLLKTCESRDCKVVTGNWTTRQVMNEVTPAHMGIYMGCILTALLLLALGTWLTVRAGWLPNDATEGWDEKSDDKDELDDADDESTE